MNAHIISALILIAAIGFYAVGASLPAGLLLILGFICEMWFWIRVSQPQKKNGN